MLQTERLEHLVCLQPLALVAPLLQLAHRERRALRVMAGFLEIVVHLALAVRVVLTVLLLQSHPAALAGQRAQMALQAQVVARQLKALAALVEATDRAVYLALMG
jgi:hypothetical protein